MFTFTFPFMIMITCSLMFCLNAKSLCFNQAEYK